MRALFVLLAAVPLAVVPPGSASRPGSPPASGNSLGHPAVAGVTGAARVPRSPSALTAAVDLLDGRPDTDPVLQEPTPPGNPDTGTDDGADAPTVHLWIQGNHTYRRGDFARVHFRSDHDAYVTIVRIDTDGRLRILWPRTSDEDDWARGDQDYDVAGSRGAAFYVDDDAGMGYVFAIASYTRFDFRSYVWNADDDGRWVDRLHGDPFVAIDRFAQHILVDDRASFATDYEQYDVDQHYDYPRFLCYDCHAYQPFIAWDPYLHPCVRFHVVIWSDPFYYPFRYYRGTRVVYVRQPRYIFKEAPRGGRVTPVDFIEHRRREVAMDPRRPGSPLGGPETGRRFEARPGPGATRPGDDAGGGGRDGGRRIETARPGVDTRGRTDNTPRREDAGRGSAQPGNGHDSRRVIGRDNGGRDNGGRDNGGRDHGGPDHGGRPDGNGGGSHATQPARRPDAAPRGPNGSERGDVFTPRRDAQPQSSPRGEPRYEARSQPRSDPQPQPRNDVPARSEPRSQPRYDAPARSEPRSQPRAEPRSQPRSEPRSQPRSEPRSQPSGDRGSSGGGSRGSTSRRRP